MLNNVDPNAVTCDTSKTGFNMLLRQPQHGSCIACCTNQSQRHRAPQDRTTVSADATASRGIANGVPGSLSNECACHRAQPRRATLSACICCNLDALQYCNMLPHQIPPHFAGWGQVKQSGVHHSDPKGVACGLQVLALLGLACHCAPLGHDRMYTLVLRSTPHVGR